MHLDGIHLNHTLLALVYLFPLVHVLVSTRTYGMAKFGWFLAVMFFSWIGYILFLIFAQPVRVALR